LNAFSTESFSTTSVNRSRSLIHKMDETSKFGS
jgi:hypothetical protein